jgi:polysaccharide biosynthesis transport protein
MKKKFRLGDIIQKINEEQAKKPEQPLNTENVDENSSNTAVPPAVVQSPGDGLPQQPHMGPPVKKSRYTFVNHNPPPAIENKYPADQQKKDYHNTTHTDPSHNETKDVNIEKFDALPERFFTDNGEDEESFDLFRYVEIILRKKNVVIAAILIMAVFSVFKYLTGARYFTAFARLLFKPTTQVLINEQSASVYSGGYEKSFTTHLELLKSHSVLAIVSQNLNHKISPEQIALGLVIKQGETNGQKNEIIELSFKNSNAELSRDVLNELCKTYIEYRRDVNSQEISRYIFKFETQINKLQIELDNKESDLRVFKEENRMVQLSSETNLTVSKISDMEIALQQTNLSLIETGERITGSTSQIGKQEQDIVQSMTFHDPIKAKIADLELELNSLTTEYSAEHFKVKMLKQQIDNLKAATIDSLSRDAASRTLVKNPIRQSLLQDIINLTVERSALEQKRIAQEKIIERLNLDLLKLPSLEQKYAYLERETESILQTLRMLKSKYEEAKIQRDSEESDLKLLEMAETPRKAITKVGFTNIIIGILIGLILGIALALLLEYLDQSLKDPREVERELELPLLGVVPQIETNKMLLEHEQATELTKTVLEPFRALRANLKHIAVQNSIKTFIVCSAIKGEGKTTLSANLAITFSLDGKKVILVDGDLRRSQIHTLFGIEKKKGFSDYLLGTSTIDDIIKPTQYPNLFIVTSGERPDNPAELLGTPRFDLLLKEIRGKADFIIFDSPALLPVSDSITMAPKMDCCVMVVRTLWTPLKAAKQAKSQLSRMGTRIFGGILNGIILSRGYYPYYYGYYGYSSYKYSYEDDLSPKFSFRELGLKIENKFRVFLKNIVYTIPRYVSLATISGKYIIARKMFWILLIIFLSLAATLIWVDSRPADTTSDDIQYIGIGGVQSTKESTAPPASDMAIPSTEHEFSTDSSSVKVKIDTVNITTSGLKDSIDLWINAFSNNDLDRYLSFYNKNTFRSVNGSFPDWKQRATLQFSNPLKKNLRIEKISIGKKGVSFIETIVRTTSIADSVKSDYDLVWQISANGWKIVGEKTLKQER